MREALRGAEEAGASIQEAFLPKYRIEYCRDCRACMSTGRCAVQDDFPKLRQLLCAADVIILNSPTYASAACARMKNLLDRLGQYAFLTSTFGDKYVIGLATASSFGAAKAARQPAASISDSVFRRAYVTGTLGVHLRGQRVSALPQTLSAPESGREAAQGPVPETADQASHHQEQGGAERGVRGAGPQRNRGSREKGWQRGDKMGEAAPPSFAVERFHQTSDAPATGKCL